MDWLLSQFGRQRPAAQRKYRAFVADGLGHGSPWEHVRGQVLLGTQKRGRESFLDSITTVSVEDLPCLAAHASLLETSRIMS